MRGYAILSASATADDSRLVVTVDTPDGVTVDTPDGLVTHVYDPSTGQRIRTGLAWPVRISRWSARQGFWSERRGAGS